MAITKTHCQICARAIKLVRGSIAHHGYQRPHHQGFQTASCYGAQFRAYEESGDALPLYIGRLQDWLKQTQEKLAKLDTNPPESMTLTLRGGWNRKDEQRLLARPEGFRVGDGVFCVRGTYEHEFYRLQADLQRTLRGLTEDIKTMELRLAAWRAP